MKKYYGGAEMYIYDAHWFSKDKTFNIEKMRSLLEKDSNFRNNELDTMVEKFMIKLLDDNDTDSLYAELDDEIKDKLGTDIKEVMRVQKNIKHIGRLLSLRDEKRNMFAKIQDQLSKMSSIEANDFRIVTKNSKELHIINPKNNYYDEITDNKLLQNLLNLYLKRKNLSGVERTLLGCDSTTKKTGTNLFSMNKSEYSTCKYIKKSL